MSLFSDVSTRTSIIEHDIAVGCAPSIKQHAYRVNPAKHEDMCKEVSYMQENGIAEPSFSIWNSLCLLVGKPDGIDSAPIIVKLMQLQLWIVFLCHVWMTALSAWVLLNMSVSLTCLKATGESLLLTEQNQYLCLRHLTASYSIP